VMTIRATDFPASGQPQPFPMQGSKRLQVPIIRSLIPDGQPRLIEAFCGSAAVAIGARCAGLVGDVVISDANQSLMRLWCDILGNGSDLATRYASIWNAQFQNESLGGNGYFNMVRARFNDAEITGEGDTADFLFLLNRIVKGSLRYSRTGAMNQSADGRRTGARPDTVRQRIVSTGSVLHGAQAIGCDWRDTIEIATTSDIIYLDPPYQGTTVTADTRYLSGLDVEVFEAGVCDMVRRNLSAIISYDAICGPAIYGRPLDVSLGLLVLDVVTGVSAQGTLLGRTTESHETIYLTPALVKRLGGQLDVERRLRSSVPILETLDLAS